MATDLTACGFGAITPDLILRALIGCVDNLAGTYTQHTLKVEIHTDALLSPVTCASWEDFQINLRKALTMDTESGTTLRVNKYSTGYEDCGGCANGTTWYDTMNSLFGMDENGLVYFCIYQTNA